MNSASPTLPHPKTPLSPGGKPVRLLAVPVFVEEDWPSIHLCADMLIEHLRQASSAIGVAVADVPYRRRLGRLPRWGTKHVCRNADRLLNRFWDYSRQLRRLRNDYDVFHICDHSYAQLMHDLPADRTGILCQDLDTFRCLLSSQDEPRPWWFRQMTRRILDGYRRAAVIFHTTNHVRSQILQQGLVDASRLVHAPLGIAPEFAALARNPPPDDAPHSVAPYLLHVGSCIPRKRIDVLLRVAAAVRSRRPDVTLIKVGGEFTTEQRSLIAELGMSDAIEHRAGIPRAELAELYRRAAVTLVTSDREGFGLPVIEALACGSVVVANDIPPLREGGGEAASYCTIEDIDSWADVVTAILNDPQQAPSVETRRQQALRFTWDRHAQVIAETYCRVAAGQTPVAADPVDTCG